MSVFDHSEKFIIIIIIMKSPCSTKKRYEKIMLDSSPRRGLNLGYFLRNH